MLYALFDTGPLLCFAGCRLGPSLLRARYSGQAGVVGQIDVELRGLRKDRSSAVSDAARRALDEFHWLERHSIEDEGLLRRAEELRDRLRAFKRRPDANLEGSSKDWGECLTLAFAESREDTVVVVANEDAVRDLAPRLEIPTASAVDVLRAMVRDKALTHKHAYTAHREMVRVTDAGAVVREEEDFLPGRY